MTTTATTKRAAVEAVLRAAGFEEHHPGDWARRSMEEVWLDIAHRPERAWLIRMNEEEAILVREEVTYDDLIARFS